MLRPSCQCQEEGGPEGVRTSKISGKFLMRTSISPVAKGMSDTITSRLPFSEVRTLGAANRSMVKQPTDAWSLACTEHNGKIPSAHHVHWNKGSTTASHNRKITIRLQAGFVHQVEDSLQDNAVDGVEEGQQVANLLHLRLLVRDTCNPT